MSPKELDRAAHRLIADKIGSGEIVQMHWAVQELINEQGGIGGDGVPFYSLCAREHVYRVVKKAVDKYGKKEGPQDIQMTMDGYDYLQEAYTMKRDGEIQLIPTHLVSDDELTARAEEFRKQAIGLNHHVKEIERYMEKRSQKRVELSA